MLYNLYRSRFIGGHSMRKILFLALIASLLMMSNGSQAQTPRPMILPITSVPGPNTWMIGQY
jgi:hypothetical protein